MEDWLITTFLLLLAILHRSVPNKAYDLSALAVITECIQAVVRNRGASVLDVGVDMSGVLTGLGVFVTSEYNVSLVKTNT